MIRRFAHLAASLAVLALALWWVSFEEVFARLKLAEPLWLALAFACLTLSTLSMTRRWTAIAETLGLEIRFGVALREYYLALAMNAFLPGGIVGDVSRAIRMRRVGDLKRAAKSVIAERVLGQAGLLIILAFGMIWALTVPGDMAWPSSTQLGIVFALTAGAVTLILLVCIPATAPFVRLCARLLMRPVIASHAILAACLLIFALYACARATGSILPFEAAVTVLPLVLCAMLVPLSVAGWGWREGAAAALFPLFGATPEAGVAMGICYGAMALLAALPGAAFALTPTVKPEGERA